MPELYTMETAEVTSSVPDKSKPTGKRKVTLQNANFPKFVPTADGFTAACDYFKDSGGIGYCMDRLNVQIGTDARNTIRSAFAATLKGPNEMVLAQKAMQEILMNEGLRNQAVAHAADPNWIQENLSKPIIERLRAEYQANAVASVPESTEAADEEEDGK